MVETSRYFKSRTVRTNKKTRPWAWQKHAVIFNIFSPSREEISRIKENTLKKLINVTTEKTNVKTIARHEKNDGKHIKDSEFNATRRNELT